MIDFKNKSFLKMKPDPEYASIIQPLLIPNEQIVDSYRSMRDGVVFTTKRIVAVNVQGITGKKRDFTSIPYSKVQVYSIETAGTFDLDAELEVWLSGIGSVKFEFSGKSSIVDISKHISAGVL